VIFSPTALDGVWQIDLERRTDPRGYFARSFCADEFAAHGLPTGFVQCNVSFNVRRGTLRGMHWQAAPHPEGKLVRCTRGAIFDVVVDLRRDSATLHRWIGCELTAENGRALYIPPGFAHGFQTLADDSEVFYQMTEAYHGDLSRGARWDDPAFGIVWPLPDPILSERDLMHPPVTAPG
jgi:dTDP-4-dehydrorhamnose 3,5-epimerase